MKKILVIEDDPIIRSNVVELVEAEGFEGLSASGGEAGIKAVKEHVPDLVICDIMMPEGDGYAVLSALRADPKTTLTPFIFLTAKADRVDMRTGMNLGADDYLTKPFTRVELLESINTRLDRVEAIAQSMRGQQFEESVTDDGARHSWPDPAGIIVEDPKMRALYEQATRVAKSPISVLVLGETGAGKEILALEIHRRSPRASGPFVALNCTQFAENLLESELFGYEKGAFTGALKSTPGLLESADGGTVFLDEIGDMPMTTQVKLLRVLEERKVMRVGGRAAKPIDVRVVSATHKDLEAGIQKGTFREDLYFRLNVVSLHIPALRERVAEIEGLAKVFIQGACASTQRSRMPALTDEALEALETYAWPGNVRELRNVIQRAVALCDGDRILPQHLPEKLLAAAAPAPTRPDLANCANPMEKLRLELKSVDRERIVEALAKTGGNQTQAAGLLGISRRTLVARLAEYDLPRPRKR